MPDGLVTVGTQVNVGPLKAGFAEAQAAVKDASQQMAEAQQQFGRAAEQGSQQAAEALKFYQVQLESARAAVADFTQTEERESTTLRSTISARMAASAELRIFEGNTQGATRAVAALIAQNETLASVATAAFVPFAAIAAIDIIGRMAEKVHNVADEFLNLRSIVVEVDKEISKEMEHGIALSEERLRLTRQQQVLAAELNGPKQGRQNRGREAGDTFDEAEALLRLRTAQDEYNLSLSTMADLKKRAQATEITPGQALLSGSAANLFGFTADAKDAQIHIREQEEIQKNAASEIANAQIALSNTINGAHVQAMESAEKVGTAEESAANKARKAWSDFVGEFVKSEQLQYESSQRVTEAIAADWLKAYHQQEEEERKQEEFSRQATREFIEDQRQKLEAAKAVIDQQARTAGDQYKGVEQRTAGQVSAGTLDPKARVALLQQAAAQEFAAQQDAVNKLKALDAGNVVAYQQDLEKEAQLQQQYALKQGQLAQQATQLMLQPYQQFFGQISSSFNTLVDKWLEGTGKMSRNFLQFGDSIAIGLVNDLLKMGEKWVEHEALMTAQHLLGITQRQTADAASAAAQQTTASTANVATALSYAAVAAAGAAAATAAIPIVGPILAPAAAATTYADTAAYAGLAAFAQGTNYVPMDGLAMLHEGETVIPKSAQGSPYKPSGGGDNHFHYSPSVSAIDGPSVAGALEKHGQAANRQFQRQMRLKNLTQ